jgi:hypothetical protein
MRHPHSRLRRFSCSIFMLLLSVGLLSHPVSTTDVWAQWPPPQDAAAQNPQDVPSQPYPSGETVPPSMQSPTQSQSPIQSPLKQQSQKRGQSQQQQQGMPSAPGYPQASPGYPQAAPMQGPQQPQTSYPQGAQGGSQWGQQQQPPYPQGPAQGGQQQQMIYPQGATVPGNVPMQTDAWGQPVPMQGGQVPQPGAYPQAQPGQPGMMPQPAMPAAAPQGCNVQLSQDRQTVILKDSAGQDRDHISLGEDRVQKIFKSKEGSWSFVVFKVRRVEQFGAFAIDLSSCQAQDHVEISAVPTDAAFEGEDILLTFSGGKTTRLKLVNRVIVEK